MNLQFHPAALNEAIDAGEYYERQRPGLRAEFDTALESGVRIVLESPDRWPLHAKIARRYLLKRFPYGIVYRVRGQTLTVYAVMHLRRRSDYWVDRL